MTPQTKMGIRPQAGPQEQFLSSSANIVTYGSARPGGKTFAFNGVPQMDRHSKNSLLSF